MADYAKKVIYLSEMEYGNKIKGAGFARMEFSGEACFLSINISGLAGVTADKYDIYAVFMTGKEYPIGQVYIHNGKGEWQAEYRDGHIRKRNQEADTMSADDMLCTQIAEVFIKISDVKVLIGATGLKKKDVKAAQIEEKKVLWNESQNRRWEFRSNMKKIEIQEESEAERDKIKEKEKSIENDIYKEREKNIEKETNESKSCEMDGIILNDKWEQLRQIYPVIHPYEDEREYISIQPKDFVIMTGDYQHLANNSFLLHGYYNYRYIILGREADGSFYLGVPGVYYEREKMVALMFGFEAFDCDGGKAEAGRFGYYLRKVKI